MKLVHRLLACGLLLASPVAWSAVNCQLSSNPSPIRITYQWWFTGGTAQGTIRLDCTRDPNGPGPQNPRRPDFWIGMAQPAGGRTVVGDTGGSIDYTLYHNTTNRGVWTNTGPGVAPGSNTNGAVLDTDPDFGPGQSMTLSRTYAFFVNVPAFQLTPVPAAGIYRDTLPFEVRLGTPTGSIVGSGALDVIISVPDSCRFSTAPSPIELNYTAFSSVPAVGSSVFGVTCTQGTSYRVALDQPNGVVGGVELAYTASLSAGTGPIAGTAAEQGYTVTVTVPAGQAGRCSTPVCVGSDSRTITVTY